jgi:hypothetical protein
MHACTRLSKGKLSAAVLESRLTLNTAPLQVTHHRPPNTLSSSLPPRPQLHARYFWRKHEYTFTAREVRPLRCC